VLDSVEQYAPGFKASIVGKEVLPPPELERVFGLTGGGRRLSSLPPTISGNIFHGSMSLDQLYLARPTPGRTGPDTPVPGLLLCGAGGEGDRQRRGLISYKGSGAK
jgi:phytoene dehydrogenase-like protein